MSNKTATKKLTKPPVAKRKLDSAGEAVIIDLISEGRGYRSIASEFDVSVSTLFDWIESDSERSKRCAKASERASDAEDQAALSAIQIAENPFELAKAREEAIHRRWRAKALAPKKYGDRLNVDATVEAKITTDSELIAQLAQLGLVVKGTS